MSSAKLTLIGINRFFNNLDQDLFKDIVIPASIDKELLTNNMLMQGGEFEVLYADPYFMQKAIGIVSRKWYPTFIKWVTAMNAEFNPIENYDRYEDTVLTNKGTVKNTGTQTSDGSYEDHPDAHNENDGEGKVSAYNSSDYEPNSSDHNEGHSWADNVGSNHNMRQDNLTQTNDITNKTIAHIHGNIGVTTSTALLNEYISLYGSFNIIEAMTDVLLKELVIPIYD